MSRNLSDISFPSSMVALLRERADAQPERRVHTFLVDGETKEVHLTYGQLDRQARAIAARLQHLGATGQRALLIYPSGLEFIAAFFGCLYAGVTAVPVYPPHPTRLAQTLPTLRGIAQDAQALFALTTSPFLAMANMMFAKDPDFGALHCLATDKVAHEADETWQPQRLNHDSLAFLQYTSGSTALPKGVMVSHGNLLHNLELISQAAETSPEIRLVSWLPVYHDMGLVVGILSPIYGNYAVTLMSPIAFLQRPRRWLQAISRIGATHSGAPNFAYDLCVRKTTLEQRQTLDLSQWEVAFNAAEPVRVDTLERFAAAFEPCGFRREAFLPCYGLAEITVGVCWAAKATLPVVYAVEEAALADNQVVAASPDAPGSKLLVGCGQAPMNQTIRIVDPDKMTGCAAHQIGEIWVSGASVTQGYWNQPEKSAQTFHAYVADSGEGPFLRTGDLGFLLDGELFVTGRMKDLIVIRGQNYYPQDIETTVEQATSFLRPGCVAAFSIEQDNQERLVIVAEVNKGAHPLSAAQTENAVKAIRRAVSEQYGLKVYAISFLKPRSIPKTSSGKIRRHACKNGFLEGRWEHL